MTGPAPATGPAATPALPGDRGAIARLIPHQGRMCLLDGVVECTPQHIRCLTRSHQSPDHPLRRAGGRLPSTAAIEYAAQAMALHGALNARPGVAGRPGFIASARGVRLLMPALDAVAGDLLVDVHHLAGDERQAMYRFAITDGGGRPLADGRVTVVLDTPLK